MISSYALQVSLSASLFSVGGSIEFLGGNQNNLVMTYSFLSCIFCLAMWGKEKATEILRDVGFTNVEVKKLPHDFQNYYYIAYKNK